MVLSFIARIRSIREETIRECAGKIDSVAVTVTNPYEIAILLVAKSDILSLLDNPAASKGEGHAAKATGGQP